MRKLSHGAALLFAGDIVARLLGMAATIHMARALGPGSYGMTIIGMGVLSYALWFADLGIMTVGTREIARPPEQRQFALADFMLVRVILAGVAFIAVQSFIHLFYPEPTLRTVIRLYLLSLFSNALLIEWYFQGLREYKPIVLWKAIAGALYVAGLWVAVHVAADVIWVPLLFLTTNLVSAIALLFRRRKEDRILPTRWQPERYRGLLRQTSTVGIGGLFAQSVQLLPPLALGYFASTSDAGILGAVLKIVFLALVIDRVFLSLFLPTVSRLWASDREQLKQVLAGIFRIVVVIAFTGATVIALFAPALLHIIYGDDYAGNAPVLALLGWFVAATLINTPISYTMIAIGQERRYLRANVVGGVISIVVTLAMTAWMGLKGAAIAMIISEICFVAVTYREFHRHFQLPLLRPLATELALAVILVVIGTMAGVGAIWQLPLVAALFIGVSYLVRGITRDEIALLLER